MFHHLFRSLFPPSFNRLVYEFPAFFEARVLKIIEGSKVYSEFQQLPGMGGSFFLRFMVGPRNKKENLFPTFPNVCLGWKEFGPKKLHQKSTFWRLAANPPKKTWEDSIYTKMTRT